MRGWAYSKLGRRAEARSDVAYAKLWKPEAAEVWQLSGKILLDEGAYAKAIAELDRAVELAPEDALTRTYRAWAHENIRHWKQAEADYRVAIEIERDAWRAAHLGKVLFRGLGRTQEAISWLQLAARLNADDADNWFELAQAQEAVNDVGAAASYKRFLNEAATPGARAKIARTYLAKSL